MIEEETEDPRANWSIWEVRLETQGATRRDCILQWANTRIGEQPDIGRYLVPAAGKRLLAQLTSPGGSMLVIEGSQGIGKTRTQRWLYESLPKEDIVSMTWGDEEAMRWVDEADEDDEDNLAEDVRCWLVDFPDYDRSLRVRWSKDVAKFFAWWGRMSSDASIVVFWQAELGTDHHFGWGKFEKVRLEPFTPEQLADYFLTEFKSCLPFTWDALLYIGELSRGVFRWFKKYINECLMNSDENSEITQDRVQEHITLDMLMKDWDRELVAIWPKHKGNRRRAVEIMRFLADAGPTPQAEVQTQFFGGTQSNKVMCSRFLTRLEDQGHIRRQYQRQTKIVSLDNGE